MGVVHEPIEDGVRNGWIADDVVPMLDGELACHDRRGAAVAIFHDLQQIAPMLGSHWGQPPVIEDQKFDAGQTLEDASMATITAS